MRWVSLMIVLVLLSVLVVAQEDISDSEMECSGLLGKIKCFFSSEEALVGQAATEAETKKASELFAQGSKEFDQDNYDEALKFYREADALVGTPNTKFAVAQTLKKQGKLGPAREVYTEVTKLDYTDDKYDQTVGLAKEQIYIIDAAPLDKDWIKNKENVDALKKEEGIRGQFKGDTGTFTLGEYDQAKKSQDFIFTPDGKEKVVVDGKEIGEAKFAFPPKDKGVGLHFDAVAHDELSLTLSSPKDCNDANNCFERTEIVDGERINTKYFPSGSKIYKTVLDEDGEESTRPIDGITLKEGQKVIAIEEVGGIGAITLEDDNGKKETVISRHRVSPTSGKIETQQTTIPAHIYNRVKGDVGENGEIKVFENTADGSNIIRVLDSKGEVVALVEDYPNGITRYDHKVALDKGDPKKGTQSENQYWNDDKLLYRQTDAQRSKDQLTAGNGKIYSITEGGINNDGTCKGTEACLVSASGDTKGLYLMGPGDNPFEVGQPALREQDCTAGDCSEDWEWEVNDIDYEGSRSCAGKCDNAKGDSDSLTIDGYRRYNTQYESVGGEDQREYNTQTVAIFSLVDAGKGWGNCEGNKCSEEVFFSSDGDHACPSEPCRRTIKDSKGNDIPNPAWDEGEDTGQEGWEDKFCKGKSSTCEENAKDASESKEIGLFLAGRQEWQTAIGGALNLFNGWSSISLALFGDVYAYELAADIDRWFAGSVLSEDYYESAFCYAEHGDIQEEGFAFIEMPGGQFVAVANIQAEMLTERSPMLCYPDPDEESDEDLICPFDYKSNNPLYCNVEDQFCYEDEDFDEEPVEGYFYKVTWRVTAPGDEALTPYSDESADVSFDVLLGEIPLYSQRIQLKNGETDGDKITHYSPLNLAGRQVCIKWRQAPVTLNRNYGRGVGAAFGAGGSTVPVEDVCFTIVPSTQGSVDFTSESSTQSTTVSKGDVDRNLNW